MQTKPPFSTDTAERRSRTGSPSSCCGLIGLALVLGSTAVARAQTVTVEATATAVPASGQSEFGRVVGAALLDDGVFAVADGGYHTVRYFDRNGSQLAAVGREGGGPGEFAGIDFVGRCAGDSVFVFDAARATMTVLGPRRPGPHVPRDRWRHPTRLFRSL